MTLSKRVTRIEHARARAIHWLDQTHGTKPVHVTAEISSARTFREISYPDKIKLYRFQRRFSAKIRYLHTQSNAGVVSLSLVLAESHIKDGPSGRQVLVYLPRTPRPSQANLPLLHIRDSIIAQWHANRRNQPVHPVTLYCLNLTGDEQLTLVTCHYLLKQWLGKYFPALSNHELVLQTDQPF